MTFFPPAVVEPMLRTVKHTNHGNSFPSKVIRAFCWDNFCTCKLRNIRWNIREEIHHQDVNITTLYRLYSPKFLKLLACDGTSGAFVSEEDSDISPREDARGGAGGGSGSSSKSNLATGESLSRKISHSTVYSRDCRFLLKQILCV